MDENTMNTIVTKYIVLGLLAASLLVASTCTYNSHDETRARMEIERQKTEAVKAERDRAMFDSMGRAAAAK